MKTYISIFLIGFIFIYSCSSLKKDNTETTYKDYSMYYSEVSKADSLFYLGQYKKSKNILDVLFKDLEPVNTYRFKECAKYIISKHHVGEVIKEKEFFDLIRKYGYTENQIKKDSVLNLYYTKFIGRTKFEELRKQYTTSISMKLREKIHKMLEKDQYYRTAYFEDDALLKGKEVDEENSRKLKELFDKNIYPSQKLIGGLFFDEKNADVEVILLHTNDKDRFEYFLPKVKEFIRQGKTNPYLYGMLIDQYHLYNNREQLYGTYNIHQLEEKKYNFYNKNRRALNIGFPSVEFDLWKDSIAIREYKSKKWSS